MQTISSLYIRTFFFIFTLNDVEIGGVQMSCAIVQIEESCMLITIYLSQNKIFRDISSYFPPVSAMDSSYDSIELFR